MNCTISGQMTTPGDKTMSFMRQKDFGAQKAESQQTFEKDKKDILENLNQQEQDFIKRYPNYYAAQNAVVLTFLRIQREIALFEIEQLRARCDSKVIKINCDEAMFNLRVRDNSKQLSAEESELQIDAINRQKNEDLMAKRPITDTVTEILTSLRDKQTAILRWLSPADAPTPDLASSPYFMTEKQIEHVVISNFPSEKTTRIYKNMKANNWSFLEAYALNQDEEKNHPFKAAIKTAGQAAAKAAAEKAKAIVAAAEHAELLRQITERAEAERVVAIRAAAAIAQAKHDADLEKAEAERALVEAAIAALDLEIIGLQDESAEAQGQWQALHEQYQSLSDNTGNKVVIGGSVLLASFGGLGLATTLGATAAISILAAIPVAGWAVLIGAAIVAAMIAAYDWHSNMTHKEALRDKSVVVDVKRGDLAKNIASKQQERHKLFWPREVPEAPRQAEDDRKEEGFGLHR
jgi:hypothetical protein